MNETTVGDVIELRAGVHWVGVLHPELRVFDSLFPTENGTTYNSYLIRGTDKIAVVDTVKGKFTARYLAKLRQLVELSKIDYVVVNHTEPDHSGALPELLKLCPQATVLCSPTASTFLGNQIDFPVKTQKVKDGDVIDLGGRHLRFFLTPFLHWPDTMFTLLEEDRLLFSCDAFGAHYCGSSMFNDEAPDLVPSMQVYFDCLMRPFKDKVLAALAKLRGCAIEAICPSHGPILRKDPAQALALYERWSLQAHADEPTRGEASPLKAVILYLSPHGNTKKMAEAVAAGASHPGVEVEHHAIDKLSPTAIRDLMEEADALIFGVPTINRDIPKPIWDVFSLLSSVKLKTSVAGVFGSFGWSGEGCKMAEERLKGLRFKLPAPAVKTSFTPDREALAQCQTLGKAIVDEVLKGRLPPTHDPAAA